MREILPELKSGDVLVSASGRKVLVQRITRPRWDKQTGIDEPHYRLIYITGSRQQAGNAVWTREDIQAAGCRLA